MKSKSSNKTKIVHAIYDSVGNPWLSGGGAERTQQIYSRLKDDFDITVYTGNYRSAAHMIDGVRYRRIGLTNGYYLSRLSYVFTMPWIMLFSKANIYIEDAGMPVSMITTAFKKRHICSVQYIPNQAYREKRGLLGLLLTHVFRICLKCYKSFVTVSDYAADCIRDYKPGANITVIPNGVTLPRKVPNVTPQYILYIGRIDIHQKGIDTLIAALAQLKNESIKCKVVIAGVGENDQVDALQKLIQKSKLESLVTYIGLVSREDRDEVYNESSFVVFPSRNETFGIVAMEAFAHSKAVVGTRTGGLTDILENSHAGLTSEPGDATGLASNIKYLIENPNEAKDMGKKGRVFANTLSWDNIAARHEQMIKEFLKS